MSVYLTTFSEHWDILKASLQSKVVTDQNIIKMAIEDYFKTQKLNLYGKFNMMNDLGNSVDLFTNISI